MRRSIVRPGIGHFWGTLTLVAVFVLCLVFVVARHYQWLPSPLELLPSPPSIKELIWKAREGDIDSLKNLATTIDPEACEVMREIVEQCENVDVKIICIRGLGLNKDYKSGPLLLMIMDKDDDQYVLRHEANLAVIQFLPDFFYDAKAPIDIRREKVSLFKQAWNMQPKPSWSLDTGK